MRRLITIGVLFGLLYGCASSTPTLAEKLDPQTSATMTYSPTPMVFYRDDPGHAAYSRNYVSLGPLQVNSSGRYRYFIWLGIWNTNQTVSVTERRDGFDSIVLFVDGEPLTLELSGWTPSVVGASEPVYPQPVASALDAYYQVTEDQIRLISDSTDIQLRTTGFSPRSFELWDDQAAARLGFKAFLAGALY